MKRMMILTSFMMITGAYAKPSLLPVKGHVETNDPSINLAEVKVKQTLECRKGWGDGERSCGKVATEASLDKNGNFELKSLKGESSRWNHAEYVISHGERTLFRSSYRLDAQKYQKAIQALLSNFTIYKLPKFEINYKTDIGMDFNEWLRTENNNFHAKLQIVMGSLGSSDVNKIRPTQNFYEGIERNKKSFDLAHYMLPGTLEKNKETKISYFVGSRFNGEIYSDVRIAQQEVNLGDPLLVEKLSNVTLQTKLINYNVDGIWAIPFSISFHRADGSYFLAQSPAVLIKAKCEASVLSGEVILDYSDVPELNEKRPLTGSCERKNASFDLDLVVTNYKKPEDRIAFQTHISISDIAGEAAKVKITNLKNGEELPTYSGAHRCRQLIKRENRLVCDY